MWKTQIFVQWYMWYDILTYNIYKATMSLSIYNTCIMYLYNTITT